MNRLISCIAAAAILFGYSMSLMASEPIITKRSYGFFAMPTQFAKDNAQMVYDYDNRADDVWNFTVFNDDIEEIKTFSTVVLPEMTTTHYSQERKYCYKNVTQVNIREIGSIYIDGMTNISEDRALDWVRSNDGFGEIATLADGTRVIAVHFFNEWDYGQKYPDIYYKRNTDGVWVKYDCTYDQDDYGPYGEWGEVSERSTSYQAVPVKISVLTFDGSDEGYVYLSQTLFGDDDSFDYILPTLKEVPYSLENDSEGRKEWGTRSEEVGFKVFNDKNEEVFACDLPAGYSGDFYEIFYFEMGGKKYIAIEAWDEKDERYSLIYRLDGNSKLPSQIAIRPSSNVSPRAPMRGELVTVTLGENAAKNGCNVNIVSANGQTVMRSKVAAGESTLSIDTARLQKGVYVVTVNTANSSSEAAKIIVR